MISAPSEAIMDDTLELESAQRVTDRTFDPVRAFIGENRGFYDNKWRWMHWAGKRRAWNGAAAWSFGGWLAYRRLWGPALAHAAWLGALFFLLAHRFPLALALVLQAGVVWLAGSYGNHILQNRFHACLHKVQHDHHDPERQEAELEAIGGPSRAAVVLYVALVLLLIVAGRLLTDTPIRLNLL